MGRGVTAVVVFCVFACTFSAAAWAARLSIPTAAKLAHNLEAKQRADRGVGHQTLGPARRTSDERITFSYSDLNATGDFRCRSTIVVRINASGNKYVASFTGTRCTHI
jgi:hypothetical protein